VASKSRKERNEVTIASLDKCFARRISEEEALLSATDRPNKPQFFILLVL
jgi:hypothetical protein